MNLRFTHLCALGLLAGSTGCAGSYTAMQPNRIATYTSVSSAPTAGAVDLAYQYDALRLRGGNKKYVKKEGKKGYHVVAIRLTNNAGRDVNFSRDLTVLSGERPITPVPAAIAGQDLKQGVPIYLLYLLLNLQIGGTRDVQTGVTTGGTFLPTGPFIAAGNMIGASVANANMRKELETYDLTNRTIKPGETVYGLLSLRETAVAPLRVELRPAAQSTALAAALPAAAPAPAPAAPLTVPR